jgi:hypothetical protein
MVVRRHSVILFLKYQGNQRRYFLSVIVLHDEPNATIKLANIYNEY